MALPATALLTAQAASEGIVCQYATGASAMAEAPFLPGVFAYIAAHVPDRATAEDLTSEVFMRMIESIHRFAISKACSGPAIAARN